MKSTWKVGARRALGTAALALIGAAGGAFADPPDTMAPPVESGDGQSAYDSSSYDAGGYDATNYDSTAYDAPAIGDAARDTVFNWREVPAAQRVPLRRAVFDQGGYQLYDTAGETIVVPFTNHNLYVMKFAPSPDGTLYFVNDGDAPILYVPRGGYLENAAAPGARWYPFSRDFHPSEPVFVGIAPSWDEFCGMGWYPRMVFYGGYWGHHSFLEGGVFSPSFGLSIFIGGHPYYGWEPYHDYSRYHEAPYHLTIVNENVYRFGGHPDRDRGDFRGTNRSYESNRSFAGRPTGPIGGGRSFDSHSFGGGRSFDNRSVDSRSFGGRTTGDSRSFGGDRVTGGGHTFQGGSRAYTSGSGQTYYAHHDFSGGRDFQGARSSSSGPVFQGRSYSGDRAYSNAGSNSGDHGFSQRPFPGSQSAPRVFSGGRSDSGRSYQAAGRPSGGSSPASADARPSSDGRRYAGGHDSRGGDGGGRR